MDKDDKEAVHKKIWIDLDNSPHVPFFAPIIEELESRGFSVVLTARDAFQVCDLADLHHFTYRRVGRHYGKHKILKVLGTCLRALQLLPFAFKERPDLAVAHGSRSQLLIATILRIPSLTIVDYEFAKPLTLFSPTWLMVPDVIPDSAVGSDKQNVLKYPGIKEDVYVPKFKPDPAIVTQLGLDQNHTVVILRPPANEAHYHNPQSDELYSAAVEFLSQANDTTIILLPRNGKQAIAARAAWPDLFSSGKMRIPEHAVDGLNLIWYADLVISGGGTMNREAAALGVPVYSIFRGHIGAVDRYLADHGRMVLLENAEDVRTKILLQRRIRPATLLNTTGATLSKVVDDIVTIVEPEYRTRRCTVQ